MDANEAKRILMSDADYSGIGDNAKNTADALCVAVDALEKQVPKKPLHVHRNYYCPVCKEDGWLLWDDADPNDFDSYCCKCGQAIDWSEVE